MLLQLHAKELDVKVAEAQGAAHLHKVAELQAALEASQEAEAAMRSHVAQMHQRMEEVQETIFKTTEVCLICLPPSVDLCTHAYVVGRSVKYLCWICLVYLG